MFVTTTMTDVAVEEAAPTTEAPAGKSTLRLITPPP